MIRAEAETCFLKMQIHLSMLLLSLMIVNISVHTKVQTTKVTMEVTNLLITKKITLNMYTNSNKSYLNDTAYKKLLTSFLLNNF